MIGVCRGAQFLCAFAGGKLIQHCGGHSSGNHKVIDIHGNVYPVTSSHHQMLDVEGTKHELVAWTPERLSGYYYGEKSEAPQHIEAGLSTFREPEVVYFPKIKALGIQGHPEWTDKSSKFVEMSLAYIESYLLTEKEWT